MSGPCYVCGRPAAVLVVVTRAGGRTTRYRACDSHEPRHIPAGDVVSISATPI